MRVVVTGARGKVGRAAATCLVGRGHEVLACDLGPPVFEAQAAGGFEALPYLRADLTDAGAAFAAVRGADAVVHAAAIPAPSSDVPHHVFANNLMATFNVVEACVRMGVPRLVNVSSETVPGFIFAERPFLPAYCPVDEEHPATPQDPYALAKLFGEQLCDAAVRRSDITAVTVRPTWVQWEGNYERNIGPYVRDADLTSITFWSYVDAYDLAELLALAAEATTPGHEVVYAAQPDNAGGRDLVQAMARHYPQVPLHALDRQDAGGISIAKARRLLGWDPRRSWRDYLDEQGRLRVPVATDGPEHPGPALGPV
ncbi:MAG TPA: NAD(P)-dependent oxidoreductase [Kineosporiaceae bacterium]|jgi:nucleoside-diphosphate-sugar epimerase|nr:NAD(P)-dependent oxidoreductase [Kineosporiaceae bacterium]